MRRLALILLAIVRLAACASRVFPRTTLTGAVTALLSSVALGHNVDQKAMDHAVS